MQERRFALAKRRELAGLCLLYVVMMLYSSTIIGPSGVNFVYRDPVEALHSLLSTPYVQHGSDQRADWVGNLLMLVPFGFMVAGTLWPRDLGMRMPGHAGVEQSTHSLFSLTTWSAGVADRIRRSRIAAACGTMLICAGVILSIKYLQLFFPPRTVTLNYILAQSSGSAVGCVAWAAWQDRIFRSVGHRDGLWALLFALRLYAGALALFILMPLDFALDAHDLHDQLRRLPDSFAALPGSNRPLMVRVMLLGVATAAFIPVGVLLAFAGKGGRWVRRSLPAVAVLGLLLTTGLYGLTALVISAYPAMPAILYRTAGILLGALSITWLVRQDLDRLRRLLSRLVPWAVLPYLLCVLLTNRLLSTQWLTIAQAVSHAYPLGLLPLFDYYIVSKAEAAKNIVGHLALYIPVGVMLWLRYGRLGSGRVFTVAASLSFVVEAGRYLRPGLEGDINAVIVAGVGAVAAARLMPVIWSMLQALSHQAATTAGRDDMMANGRAGIPGAVRP